MLQYALRYATELNWWIFPCHTPIIGRPGLACSCEAGKRKKQPSYQCSSPGKHPRTMGGLDDATLDPDQIREWWDMWPAANIGINCGKSGILVIDLDLYKDTYSGHNMDLDEETVTAITGGGGTHLFYRLNPGDTFGNGNKDLPGGIDIRAHGGYVIAAPSLHISGRRYQWEMGYEPWN